MVGRVPADRAAVELAGVLGAERALDVVLAVDHAALVLRPAVVEQGVGQLEVLEQAFTGQDVEIDRHVRFGIGPGVAHRLVVGATALDLVFLEGAQSTPDTLPRFRFGQGGDVDRVAWNFGLVRPGTLQPVGRQVGEIEQPLGRPGRAVERETDLVDHRVVVLLPGPPLRCRRQVVAPGQNADDPVLLAGLMAEPNQPPDLFAALAKRHFLEEAIADNRTLGDFRRFVQDFDQVALGKVGGRRIVLRLDPGIVVLGAGLGVDLAPAGGWDDAGVPAECFEPGFQLGQLVPGIAVEHGQVGALGIAGQPAGTSEGGRRPDLALRLVARSELDDPFQQRAQRQFFIAPFGGAEVGGFGELDGGGGIYGQGTGAPHILRGQRSLSTISWRRIVSAPARLRAAYTS